MRTYPTVGRPTYFPTPYPLPPVPPATPRIRVRPTPPDILDKLWNKNQEREELERKRDLDEKSKRIRDRISSETAENTALIIGIVAGALIAVILVVLLVLKLKSRGNSARKVDERMGVGGGKNPGGGGAGGKGAPPSHSNSNAALLNPGSGMMGSGGMMGGPMMRTAPLGGINPVLGGLDSKKPSPPSKKCGGKDIKEWYV